MVLQPHVRPVAPYCTGDLSPAPEDWSRGDWHSNEVATPLLNQRGSRTTPIASRNFSKPGQGRDLVIMSVTMSWTVIVFC